MQKLQNILGILLSIVLPKESSTILLENMSMEEINILPKANTLDDGTYRALFQYKNKTVRLTIWEIKYKANKKITALFSKLLYEFILEEIVDEIVFSNFQNPLLIPIPASKGRIRERGFNQCELILKEIQKLDTENFFKVSFNALRKIKETPHQSKLKNKEKRLKNLKGCFLADPGIVAGRNVVLIDDVITTGQTMKEAAKTLRGAGAKKVIGFAIAH